MNTRKTMLSDHLLTSALLLFMAITVTLQYGNKQQNPQLSKFTNMHLQPQISFRKKRQVQSLNYPQPQPSLYNSNYDRKGSYPMFIQPPIWNNRFVISCFICQNNPKYGYDSCPATGWMSKNTKRIPCEGSCFSQINKYQPEIIYRGCAPLVNINYKGGCHSIMGTIVCFCSYSTCNHHSMKYMKGIKRRIESMVGRRGKGRPGGMNGGPGIGGGIITGRIKGLRRCCG